MLLEDKRVIVGKIRCVDRYPHPGAQYARIWRTIRRQIRRKMRRNILTAKALASTARPKKAGSAGQTLGL